MSGLFISIEGPDGAGKSTVLALLAKKIEETSSMPVMVTREPGGIPISEQIREVILDPKNIEMDERTEALLYAAARRQHLSQKVLPAIENGHLVLCDRFIDSSIAYQGVARGIGKEEVRTLNEFAIEGRYPDMTLYLDVEAAVGLDRIARGRGEEALDRLDKESLAFHEKVRQAYLDIVMDEPERVFLVDTQTSIETVVKNCYDLIIDRFPGIFSN